MWLGSISTWPRGEATMSVTDIAAIEAAICEVRDAMEENLCPILGFLVGLVRVDWCLKRKKKITKSDRRFSTCQAKQRCPPRRSSQRFPGSPGFLSSSPFSFLLRNWYNLNAFSAVGRDQCQCQSICLHIQWSIPFNFVFKKFVLPTSNAHASVAHRTPAAKKIKYVWSHFPQFWFSVLSNVIFTAPWRETGARNNWVKISS